MMGRSGCTIGGRACCRTATISGRISLLDEGGQRPLGAAWPPIPASLPVYTAHGRRVPLLSRHCRTGRAAAGPHEVRTA